MKKQHLIPFLLGLFVLLVMGAAGVNSIFKFNEWKLNNPTAGQVVGFHDANSLTNLDMAAGGSGLTTNANQFAANPTLNIKNGALLTNTFFYGPSEGDSAITVEANRRLTIGAAGYIIDTSGEMQFIGDSLFSDNLAVGSGGITISGNSTFDADIGTVTLTASGNIVSSAIIVAPKYWAQQNIWFSEDIVAGVGGANTNFTLQASGDESIIYVSAATNVNIVAIMGGIAARTSRVTLIATNRTGTSRPLSLGAATNNFISLQKYDGIQAPFVVTNGLALRVDFECHGTTNVYYSAKPHDLPTE